uniref:Uncharacterized protein n=1 Tax=Magnetospirillum gryphiswaldense TaxID=55518 RepID=A4TW33_9PROT|nr:hypothetical protein MGR_3767 [Magnetospirillum gryphiswaldense MSR-1]
MPGPLFSVLWGPAIRGAIVAPPHGAGPDEPKPTIFDAGLGYLGAAPRGAFCGWAALSGNGQIAPWARKLAPFPAGSGGGRWSARIPCASKI